MAGYIKGVDVASYQSTTYSLSGVDFVFVKATEGTAYTNPKMAAQAQRARNAGVVTGFYHFLRKGDIKAQAAYFVKKAGARNGEILACDWESAPDGTYPSNAEKDAFIKEVKRLAPTHRVILYCNVSFWKTRDATSYAGDGLWIADPSGTSGKPRVQHAWMFHQYSISGGMDRNVAAFTSRSALATWAAGLLPAAGKPEKPSSGGASAVALTASQTFDAVWKTDKFAAPDTSATADTNKTWQPQSWITDTGNRVRSLETEVAAVRAQAEANGKALLTVLGKLDALSASQGQS